MTNDARTAGQSARRFRDAALTYVDDVYTLARFLMHHPPDAEDAVQECYRRARAAFDDVRDRPIKPWLLAMLRDICYAHLGLCSRHEISADLSDGEYVLEKPLWQQPNATDSAMPTWRDKAVIHRLVVALPMPFREVLVLREFIGLTYREIAEVVGAPIGTIVARLARARAMLLVPWQATDGSAPRRPKNLTHGMMRIDECAESIVISD
jgi:RNA polymerase sigma-70 factor, ECF subfamily